MAVPARVAGMNRLANKLRSFLRPTGTSTRTTPPSTGPVVEYTPTADGQPDPGEVVWAWVAYEDDPSQGKDRPVLVIGRDGDTLLALQLSSQDHDLDAEDEARYGRYWMDVGTGGWDAERRPSEVRLDRLLRMRQDEVRREGASLDRAVFDAVVREVRGHHDLP